MISTLTSSITKLDDKVKENITSLAAANKIVETFKKDSSALLDGFTKQNRKSFFKNLLMIGGISFILNGIIMSLFFWIGNANVNKQLIMRESAIYEKLMQIDRVQRGEAKFYFDKKDNALYLQDAKKRNVPEKLESETTYLKGFWESFWD